MSDMKALMRNAYMMGWAVIPLKKGSKEPNLPVGHPYLTRHPTWEEYRSFQWGNYGIVTGAMSGLTILDIDGAEGLESLEEHEVRNVLDTETPQVHTPNGTHVYFQHSPAVKTCVDFFGNNSGIDVRSTGAYVVGAGSMVDGEYYAWDDAFGPDTPLAPVPNWMLDKQTRERSIESWKIGATISDGKRNNTLISLAGTLVVRDLPGPVVLDMLRVVNYKMCRPPLDDEEIIKIAESAERYRG